MLKLHSLRIKNFLSVLSIFILFVGSLFFSGCQEGIGQFRVKVISPDWQPIEAATVSGGIDWEYFQVQTDSRGYAILPSFAFGHDALIYKNNFIPKIVDLSRHFQDSIFPRTYVITPTQKRFRFIGNVEGWSIRFDSNMLITVDYRGGYHVYSYDDQGIAEIATAQMSVIALRDTQLHKDKLWISTHNDGIYVYSLEDPLNPVRLFHLDIPGYLGRFALRDGILIVSRYFGSEPLSVYSYNASGEYQELAQFGNYWVNDLAFVGNYIVIVSSNYDNGMPAVYDIEDPSNPYLVYEGTEPDYLHGFLYGNYLIFVHQSDFDPGEEETVHKLIDLSDPRHPSTVGNFTADAQVFKIINDSTAMGKFNVWTGAVSILDGSLAQGFKTIAVITDNPFSQVSFHQFEGCAPPFFIIGECLYKLEEW